VTDNEKAVALYHGEARPLAKYGESKVVRIVKDRIMALDARKEKLNDLEALTLAQCAVATRMSPFPPENELHAWVKVFQGKRTLTIMRGRDGSLKRAKENMAKVGTHMESPRFRQLIDPVERQSRLVPDGALAYDCAVSDYLSLQTYFSAWATMKDSGLSGEAILRELGPQPADHGLGVLTAEEIDHNEYYTDAGGKKHKQEIKYNHEERCRKRALIAALRVRWMADEAVIEGDLDADVDDYIIDSEWRLIEPPKLATTTEERGSRAAKGATDLFGDPVAPSTDRRSPTYWPKATLTAIVEGGFAANNFEAAGMLSYSAFDKSAAPGPSMIYAKAYRAARDEDKKPDEAGKIGMAAYLETLKGGKG
jgi:hypothetical protein